MPRHSPGSSPAVGAAGAAGFSPLMVYDLYDREPNALCAVLVVAVVVTALELLYGASDWRRRSGSSRRSSGSPPRRRNVRLSPARASYSPIDARRRLEAILVSESEAYGYTLSIWGSGALLIHSFGVPGVERALAYVAGALAGFGVLAVVAFQGFSVEATVKESPSSLVVSTIHIIATGGTLAIVHFSLLLAGGRHPLVVFFAVGLLATVAYNLLLLIEQLAVQVLV